MTIGVTARPLRAGAAMVAAVALLLAGCNGGGEVEPSPTTESPSTAEPSTPTESPTETETPTPDPTETSALPELPEEATENTPEGAEAFIRYYFDVANLLLQSPEVGKLIELGIEECLTCQSMEARIVDLEAAGQRARSDVYSISSMAPVGGVSGDVKVFNMEVDLLPTAILDEDGSISQDSGASTLTGEGAAIWKDGQWAVFDIGLQS